jgi:hypothetical protein
MTHKQRIREYIDHNLQGAQFEFQEHELYLVKVLLVALEQDSYEEFRNIMLYAIAEFPDLFRNEHFSQDQIAQIQTAFHEESYAQFRQILISIENRCGTRWCTKRSICAGCEFLIVASELSYEDFKITLRQKLLN